LADLVTANIISGLEDTARYKKDCQQDYRIFVASMEKDLSSSLSINVIKVGMYFERCVSYFF